MTLEYLEVIEETLKKRYANDHLLLCDYFDLIGGTSTGSIIAAGLACGMPVAQIKELYYDLGRQVFQTDAFAKLKLKGILAPKFPTEPLRKALNDALGADTTLDSDAIRTGLMVMTKRLDTGSPWPLHNSPASALRQAGRRIALDPDRAREHGRPDLFRAPVDCDFLARRRRRQRRLCRRRRQPFQ